MHSILTRIAACALLLGAASVQAQSLSLSPAAVPLKGTFGQSTTQTLTLANGTDQPLDFEVEVRDVVVRDGVRVFAEAGSLPGSIAATAVYSPRQVRLAPHASASVRLTVTIPPATQQRAVVALFQGRSLLGAGGRQARLSLGGLLTFTLTDRISVTGTLATRPPDASGNAQVIASLVNDGTEPVVPNGMAALISVGGQVVGKAPFAAHRLLPGERATVAADYAGELASGSYRTVATFDIEGRPLILDGTLAVP